MSPAYPTGSLVVAAPVGGSAQLSRSNWKNESFPPLRLSARSRYASASRPETRTKDRGRNAMRTLVTVETMFRSKAEKKVLEAGYDLTARPSEQNPHFHRVQLVQEDLLDAARAQLASYLNAADHSVVTQAVAEAELTTSGEIVTVLAERSDGYSDVVLLWAAAAAFTAMSLFAAFPQFFLDTIDGLAGGWSHQWSVGEAIAWAVGSAGLPTSADRPNTSSTLPMIEPVIDAFTRSW